jgi:hypothetical protein
MTELDFLAAIDDAELTTLDRALALLWWAGRLEPSNGISTKEICGFLERSGQPKQNVARLNQRLADDRRTAKAGEGAWRLHPRARKELDLRYGAFRHERRQAAATDSVLPRDLFSGTRGYLERVVYQVNASYDSELFDCCAVMCRRTLETLLIEVYEAAGRANEIKGSDGQFLMFAGLLAYFESDGTFHMSRNGVKGLRDFKTLGDLSAHNRRFNARQDDIDRIRAGLRVAAEELLHLARLAPHAAPSASVASG